MKQIFLLLLLLPCLCLAQYTGNANQKITLGEQSTADGLVYRGVENDTANITPRSDTSAYIILDTVNNKFYNYNRTTNVWSLAGGGVSVSSFSAGTTGLTPSTATTGAVTLGGTLAVANGGTGITSLGTGVATFLGTPSSANLAAAVTNETGSGALVFGTSPTLVTPALGTPSSGVLTSATGLPLTTGVTGVLPVANGGTGQTSTTAALNALLPTQSQSTTIGATLKSNGTNSYWDNFSAAGTVQDQSGNFYNTVAIGTQVWFKENLRTKKYRSGALIPVKTNTDTSTIVGQMYYYSNDSLTNYSIGALYNWKATQNSDSLCPVGWKVPTDAEWTTLTTFLVSVNVAGGKMKLTGTTYWNSPNTNATNESGFSALPGGYRDLDGSFDNVRNSAFFWSATENDTSNAWSRFLFYNSGNALRFSGSKAFGASVRCLKQ